MHWKAAIRSPRSLLFSRLNSPNSPSLSSQESCSSPQIIFVASSGPAPTHPGLSCAKGSRAGCRTPTGSHQSRAEGQNHLPRHVPTLLGMQLRVRLAFWAVSAHCWAVLSFSSTSTPCPSRQGCSHTILCPACICAWDCPNPGAGTCTWPC